MSKFSAIALTALTASLFAAAPAQAASYHDARHYSAQSERYAAPRKAADLQRDIYRLDNRINRAYAKRQISRREASGLQRDANSLQRLFAQYKRGGLTRQEARVLEVRLARMDRALHSERRDFDRRRG